MYVGINSYLLYQLMLVIKHDIWSCQNINPSPFNIASFAIGFHRIPQHIDKLCSCSTREIRRSKMKFIIILCMLVVYAAAHTHSESKISNNAHG